MNRSRSLTRVLAVLLVTLIALATRLRAVEQLPVDYDEDDYLRAGQQYAAYIASGDLRGLTEENYRTEHPPLAKLAYGVALAPLPPAPEVPDRPTTAPPATSLPQPHFTVARLTAALFGVLQVLALAILNPLAGFFLAIQTWEIKYTSQIMLEALPSLTSALAVVFYLKSGRQSRGWLALSAAALGLTAASKYLYCVVGIAIVADWLWKTYPDHTPRTMDSLWRWLRPAVAWGVGSVVVFFLADPYLWPDPINRLKDSIVYHAGYAQSEAVAQAGFPTWQPLVWLAESVPWHPNVFPFGVDFYISVFALLGVRRMWNQSRVMGLWLLVALGFLLVWTTKWPQYILILTFPLSLAAAEGVRSTFWIPMVGGLRGWRSRRGSPGRRREARLTGRETRRALPWLIPGLLALLLIVAYPMIYQSAMTLTDFSAIAIRDGINGGVWRAVSAGLSGSAPPVEYNPFAFSTSLAPQTVRYAGPNLLLGLFLGGVGDVVAFEAIWTILSVGLQTALGLAVALALHRRGVRFRGWWRALFILPWAIPEFVGALVWSRFFEPTTGSLSLICGCPLEWATSNDQTLLVLLISATWMGWPLIMLAASAGLKLLPPEVYDAAAIDGANGLQQFRFITWPLVLPLLVPAIIIRSIFAFNQFYLFVVMQADYPTTTLATLSYFFFNYNGQYALSAIINLFAVAMLVIFILMLNRWTKAAEGVTYA